MVGSLSLLVWGSRLALGQWWPLAAIPLVFAYDNLRRRRDAKSRRRCAAPLPNGTVREALLRLCAKAGTDEPDIYLVNDDQRNVPPACCDAVDGRPAVFLSSRAMALNDREIVAVFAHELAHLRLNHHVQDRFFQWAVVLAGTAGAWFALPLMGAAKDVVTQAAGVIVVISALFLAGDCFHELLSTILNRRHERRADAWAIKITDDPDAMVAAAVKMVKDG
jgi:Zn-dependent protease with chaperone function